MARSIQTAPRKTVAGPQYEPVKDNGKVLRMTREGMPALVVVKRIADGTEHLAREGERDQKDADGKVVTHPDGPLKGKPVRETVYKPTADLADLADAFAPQTGILAP